MTRYPRQIDGEYLSSRSGGLNKIQMIDGGTLDLHQDLVACDRERRYIVEHQLPTVFQQSDSFHANSPSFKSAPCAHARGRLRIQNMPFVLAAGTFGARCAVKECRTADPRGRQLPLEQR